MAPSVDATNSDRERGSGHIALERRRQATPTEPPGGLRLHRRLRDRASRRRSARDHRARDGLHLRLHPDDPALVNSPAAIHRTGRIVRLDASDGHRRLGRDIRARKVLGGRISLMVGVISRSSR